MEGLVADWCAANGFGSDPVTVSTFSTLINSLMKTLPAGSSDESVADEDEFEISLSDEDLVAERVGDEADVDSLLIALAGEENQQAHKVPGTPDPSRNIQPVANHVRQPASSKMFVDASGDWKEFFDGVHWWAIGHYLVYPARDCDHAERLCGLLRKEEYQS